MLSGRYDHDRQQSGELSRVRVEEGRESPKARKRNACLADNINLTFFFKLYIFTNFLYSDLQTSLTY